MEEAILRAIKDRNISYINFRKTNKEDSFNEYKKLRNKVNILIESAKKSYFNEKIAEHKNDPGKLWKCLKQLGYSTKTKSNSSTISLSINNKVTSNKNEVANSLN